MDNTDQEKVLKPAGAPSGASWLRRIVEENHAGTPVGICSICSANRWVLEAAMRQAAANGTLLCIESTSNQVNQEGGYTGQVPAEFATLVFEMAKQMKLASWQVVLGGDHLGPHVWRRSRASEAMLKACELVRQSVLAGYTKIHLDASQPCADDPQEKGRPLNEEVICQRAAEMCRAAEDAWRGLAQGSQAPLYVVGTEVPIPGGDTACSQAPVVTEPDAVLQTLEMHKSAFQKEGIAEAWERLIGVVVQPGVEFGDSVVFGFDRDKASALPPVLQQYPGVVFEAHSTDYQTAHSLRQMVEDHFAILKVGPWLTFALREGLFALEAAEREWLAGRAGFVLSGMREALESAMLDNPVHWKDHYRGDPQTLVRTRAFSLSDRARYYWQVQAVLQSVERLVMNLDRAPIPLSLLSQYLPHQYQAVRDGRLENHPRSLIHHKIQEVLATYADACGASRA